MLNYLSQQYVIYFTRLDPRRLCSDQSHVKSYINMPFIKSLFVAELIRNWFAQDQCRLGKAILEEKRFLRLSCFNQRLKKHLALFYSKLL
jgi:hypothetical protein